MISSIDTNPLLQMLGDRPNLIALGNSLTAETIDTICTKAQQLLSSRGEVTEHRRVTRADYELFYPFAESFITSAPNPVEVLRTSMNKFSTATNESTAQQHFHNVTSAANVIYFLSQTPRSNVVTIFYDR